MESAEDLHAPPRLRVCRAPLALAFAAGWLCITSLAHSQTIGPQSPRPTHGVQANPAVPQAAPLQAPPTSGTAIIDETELKPRTPIRRGNAGLEDTTGRSTAGGNPIWTTLGVLCLLLAGLFGILKLIQRYGPGRFSTTQTQHIHLVDRQRLDTQTTIYLLRVGRRVIVAGHSAGGLSTLAEIDDPAEVAELFGSQPQTETDRNTLGSLFSGSRGIRREAASSEPVPSPSAKSPVGAEPQASREGWHA